MEKFKVIVREKIGEVAGIFMSEDKKGTEIIMPTEELLKISEDIASAHEEAIELAWGIIANAYGGDWSKASDEWRSAAEKWRDTYL